MSDLLDILADLDHDPADDLVHAVRPNMWGACGWSTIGLEGRPHDTYVLVQWSTAGVTCQACLDVMEALPWPA